jgi:hypothetical protein
MNACEFEIYFDEYICGELDRETDIRFQNHLQECNTCRAKLDDFYEIHHQLKTRKRAKLTKATRLTYHAKLKKSLLINAPVQRFSSFFNKLIYTRSPWIRLAEAMVILIVGIGIGMVVLSGSKEPDGSSAVPTSIVRPELFAQPVSKVDLEYMTYYFSASEMILLELSNYEQDVETLFLEKEVAQKLLMKTFLVHEIALRLNEPDILNFLSHMEFILYDLANTPGTEIDETMSEIKSLIEQKRLLKAIQVLQKRLNSESPDKVPG